MKQIKKHRHRTFLSLTPAERELQTSRFDHEIDIEKETRPLTPKERLLFERIRRRRGQSVYPLPVDNKLLGKALAAAREQGVPLDEFIASSIRATLAFSRR